jgi:hypothetical protein
MGWLACLAVPVVAIRFLAAFNRPGSDAESETIAIGLLIIILGGMGVGFLRGQPWARRFYLWATPVGLAWRLAQNLTTPSELGWWRFGLGLGVYAFWAFVLTRPRARAYFTRTADQR